MKAGPALLSFKPTMWALLLLATLIGSIIAQDKCIQCICNQESGCAKAGCQMNAGSLSCGYYGITLQYYKDCGEPEKHYRGEPVETAWKRCADDYICATNCVKSYISRNSPKCRPRNMTSCEKAARIHNGGPSCDMTAATNGYWSSIKKCFDA